MLRRDRFALVALVLALAAFYAGTQFVTGPAARPRHPITGRQIAGLATDASWLDRVTREREEAPAQALALIGIHEGMVVADIGAGSGYMTTRLSPLVGSTGKVYATDVQPGMLQIIAAKAQAARLTNITTVQGTETDTNLPEATIDMALLVDVYHELTYPQAMLRSIRRALNDGGELVLIEYRREDPAIPIAATHRMSVADLKTEIGAEGFTFDRILGGLPRQHIVIFRK